LCKINKGSGGYKKRVKKTGYAIKNASRKFSKKMLKILIKCHYLEKKNYKKKRGLNIMDNKCVVEHGFKQLFFLNDILLKKLSNFQNILGKKKK